MLFLRDILQGIAEGRVTLAFRRWRRAPPADGSSVRSPVGVLCLDRVTVIDQGDITMEDVRRTGQQIHVLERSRRARPRLSRSDRVFWVWLSRMWVGWRRALIIVQPATVLASRRKASGGSGGGKAVGASDVLRYHGAGNTTSLYCIRVEHGVCEAEQLFISAQGRAGRNGTRPLPAHLHAHV